MICPPAHAHDGTRSCYTKHKCRCDRCQVENRQYQRRDRLLQGADVRVSALGSQRRLQALAFMGWSAKKISIATGMHVEIISRIRRGAKHTIVTSTHVKIEEVFRTYAMRRDLSKEGIETSERARKAGWVSPLAWDDIDNPTERERGALPSKRVRGRQVKARTKAIIEDLEFLISLGVENPEASDRLGIKPESLFHFLTYHERKDLWARIQVTEPGRPLGR